MRGRSAVALVITFFIVKLQPEVGGFTSYESLELVRNIKELNFVGFDVVEVLPAYDHGEITAYLAANLVFEFLSILAVKKKEKGAI